MAHTVKFIQWGESAPERVDSVRKYDVFETIAVLMGEDRWTHNSPVTLTLYVDSETGVVVQNIGLYEKSLGL